MTAKQLGKHPAFRFVGRVYKSVKLHICRPQSPFSFGDVPHNPVHSIPSYTPIRPSQSSAHPIRYVFVCGFSWRCSSGQLFVFTSLTA